MANLDSEIIIKQELRPCLVNGKKALFHKWYEEKNIKQAILRGEIGGEVSFLWAVVEFENGIVQLAHFKTIKFSDNKMKEFCFEEETNDIFVPFPDDDDLPF